MNLQETPNGLTSNPRSWCHLQAIKQQKGHLSESNRRSRQWRVVIWRQAKTLTKDDYAEVMMLAMMSILMCK